MESRDEWRARRLAEIREREAQLDREAAERAVADSNPATAAVDRRKTGHLRSAMFLTVLVGAAAGLLGLAITCFRLAGYDIDDATRARAGRGRPILAVALVPGLISVLVLRELFRFRRR